MRFYYDTEFIEIPTKWGNVYDLISIGIVAEDSREFYAVNADADWRKIQKNPWLMRNVVAALPQGAGDWKRHMPRRWPVNFYDRRVMKRDVLAAKVLEFLTANDDPIELWADHVAHDHVILTGLFGGMGDLPARIPMRTNDVAQEIERITRELGGVAPPVPVQAEGLHNAIADARHVAEVGRWLAGYVPAAG